MKSDDLLLYAVTDESWLGNRSLEGDVERAIKGGATMIQLREKNEEFDTFLEKANKIKEVCDRHNVTFIVNDNVEIARLCGAHGVHVGQGDSDVHFARKALGDDKIVGVSASDVGQATAAQDAGADYIGVGAVFTTGTKLDADAVSLDTLCDICKAVSIPVVAIGGITLENMHKLNGLGLSGVAVVSAIFAQNDIEQAASKLLKQAKEL